MFWVACWVGWFGCCFGLCFVASAFFIICHLSIANVCVINILSTGNTQNLISILLLCFLYLFVELMITTNE